MEEMINGPENEDDPPGCKGCSVGEAGIVTIDKYRAREIMLPCAISKLDSYTQEAKDALASNFGGANSEALASYISGVSSWVKQASVGSKFQAQDQGDGLCSSGTNAWTYPAIQFADVRLCRPSYWNRSDIDRSRTLIHEWFHLYYLAGDIAYAGDEDFSNLNTLQQLFNADAFAQLIYDLCG